jgi:hypothetical protein
VVLVEGELGAAPVVPVWLELWLALLLSGVLCPLGLLTPVWPLLCADGAVAELSGVLVVWFGVEEFCPAACDGSVEFDCATARPADSRAIETAYINFVIFVAP